MFSISKKIALLFPLITTTPQTPPINTPTNTAFVALESIYHLLEETETENASSIHMGTSAKRWLRAASKPRAEERRILCSPCSCTRRTQHVSSVPKAETEAPWVLTSHCSQLKGKTRIKISTEMSQAERTRINIAHAYVGYKSERNKHKHSGTTVWWLSEGRRWGRLQGAKGATTWCRKRHLCEHSINTQVMSP